MFRLRPMDVTAPVDLQAKITDLIEADLLHQVAIEEQRTEKSYLEPDRQPYEVERRESGLVQSLATHIRGRATTGSAVLRWVHRGEFKPLCTDLYDETADVLVEAKGASRVRRSQGHRPARGLRPLRAHRLQGDSDAVPAPGGTCMNWRAPTIDLIWGRRRRLPVDLI